MHQKYAKVAILMLATTFVSQAAHAQTMPAQTMADAAAETMRQVIAGGIVDDAWTRKAEKSQLIEIARSYLENDYPAVRSKAVGWLAVVLSRAAPPMDRQLAADLLLAVTKTPADKPLPDFAIGYLTRFSCHDDFTKDGNKILEKLLAGKSPSRDVILIAGISASEPLVTRLKELAKGGSDADTAKVALARAGDPELAIWYAHRFEAMDKTEQLRRLHTLAYTRSPQAVELLKKFVMSDEKLPDDGDALGPKLWHLALPELAPMLEGFPSPANAVFRDSDLETYRNWLNTHPTAAILK